MGRTSHIHNVVATWSNSNVTCTFFFDIDLSKLKNSIFTCAGSNLFYSLALASPPPPLKLNNLYWDRSVINGSGIGTSKKGKWRVGIFKAVMCMECTLMASYGTWHHLAKIKSSSKYLILKIPDWSSHLV